MYVHLSWCSSIKAGFYFRHAMFVLNNLFGTNGGKEKQQ